MALAGFVVAGLVNLIFSKRKPGCWAILGTPAAAAVIFGAFRINAMPASALNSTSGLYVPFAGIWALAGALPGWMLSDWLKRLSRMN